MSGTIFSTHSAWEERLFLTATATHLRLLIVDEAESLPPECYDLLQYFFEQTHCPLLLLGALELPTKVGPNARFSSRVGFHRTFADPTEREENKVSDNHPGEDADDGSF